MKIIAEIGWNHCGDIKLAKQMAKAAHEYMKKQNYLDKIILN